MSQLEGPLFLAKQSYRRRRVADAARVLPMFGIVLVLLPVLWSETARTGTGLIYIFCVWAILIGLVFLLSRRLADGAPDDGENNDEQTTTKEL